MNDITSVGWFISEARRRAGLSQQELATRAGTSQPSLARLESGQANPTVATVERIVAAAGFQLHCELVPMEWPDPIVQAYKQDVDRTMIRENLRRTIDERLRLNEESLQLGAELQRALADHDVEYILVGGIAARAHGSARITQHVDICYARSDQNLARIVRALTPFSPYLRGAPSGLPFEFTARTLRAGLNFTLTTSVGDIDLFGDLIGGGGYEQLESHSSPVTIFGRSVRLIDLPWLIRLKRAAGRPKDHEVLAELEALQEERAAGEDP